MVFQGRRGREGGWNCCRGSTNEVAGAAGATAITTTTTITKRTKNVDFHNDDDDDIHPKDGREDVALSSHLFVSLTPKQGQIGRRRPQMTWTNNNSNSNSSRPCSYYVSPIQLSDLDSSFSTSTTNSHHETNNHNHNKSAKDLNKVSTMDYLSESSSQSIISAVCNIIHLYNNNSNNNKSPNRGYNSSNNKQQPAPLPTVAIRVRRRRRRSQGKELRTMTKTTTTTSVRSMISSSSSLSYSCFEAQQQPPPPPRGGGRQGISVPSGGYAIRPQTDDSAFASNSNFSCPSSTTTRRRLVSDCDKDDNDVVDDDDGDDAADNDKELKEDTHDYRDNLFFHGYFGTKETYHSRHQMGNDDDDDDDDDEEEGELDAIFMDSASCTFSELSMDLDLRSEMSLIQEVFCNDPSMKKNNNMVAVPPPSEVVSYSTMGRKQQRRIQLWWYRIRARRRPACLRQSRQFVRRLHAMS